MISRQRSRRLVDIAVSVGVLAALAPVFAILALLIWIFDGRPVLFRQWRVGQHGELFRILKFRTMSGGSGGAVTGAGDPRVTRLGRHLRRLKIDELPQFLNVLKGEMSLIGPRPEVPKFVDLQNESWRNVLQVKPGITYLATLCFRNEEEILAGAGNIESVYRRDVLPVKLRLNARYLAQRNWRTDLLLLWLTVCYSLFPKAFDQRRIAGFAGIPQRDLPRRRGKKLAV